jgi:TRAP-type C4-dicarboxylate transport system substrate-binding protein
MKTLTRLVMLSACAPVALMGPLHAAAAEKFAYDGPVITLRLSHSAPATFPTIKTTLDPWTKMVEKESNGKIRVQTYYGGVLHSAKDGFKAAVNDITDFTPAYTMYQAGSFNLHHVLGLPFAFPNAAVASRVAEELYPKYFKKEYEAMGVYLANYSVTGAYNLFTKKPVRKLEELKGMKIRSSGGSGTAMIKSLGGAPVTTPAPEAYAAFQRGMVDGVAFYDTGAIGYRIHEVSRYLTELKLNNSPLAYAFNRKTFDSYPPEVKRFMYAMLRRLNQMSGNGFDEHDLLSRKVIEEKGVKVIKPSPEELAEWKAAVEPMWEEFIRENEAKGLPARQLVQDLRALTQKYASWTPEQLMQHAIDHPVRGIIDGM